MADHPASDARRSRAARRNRSRRSASPSQARSAAPSAAGSSGGTSRPGPDAVGGVTEGLRHAADVGRDDRQATRQRLGHDHAVGLGARRQHQQVRGGVAALEIGAGPRAREAHPIAQPASSAAATETLDERRVAVQAAHAHAVPGQVRGRRQRIEQHVVPLVGGHRGDAEQRPARRRPGREVGRVDAGLGDVDPVGRQRVQLQQPAAGPRAGRDDGGGGREDCAFPLPRLARAVGGRAMAQRHVHEHDQPQPARLRHQHPGCRRGDQAVEQHDGAVGDPLRRRRRGRRTTPRRVAARSRARRARAPTSRPAASPRQTLAVIDVASARPGRVVDAVGYDDVHRLHSDRS